MIRKKLFKNPISKKELDLVNKLVEVSQKKDLLRSEEELLSKLKTLSQKKKIRP